LALKNHIIYYWGFFRLRFLPWSSSASDARVVERLVPKLIVLTPSPGARDRDLGSLL